MKKIYIILLIILSSYSLNNSYGYTAEKSFVTEVMSTDLKATNITPIMETMINTHENLIFCSTFQMVWNEMCNKYADGPLEIPEAPMFTDNLNKLYKQPALIDAESYIAMSGLGKENIVKKINQTVKKRFGHLTDEELPPELKDKLRPNDILAFSYLYKNLEFDESFENIKPIAMTINNNVFLADAFGIIGDHGKEKLYKQVKIKYFNDKNNAINSPKGIILSLITNSSTDELIISDITISGTLFDNYKKINELIKANADLNISNNNNIVHINKYDAFSINKLAIPKLNFNIFHEFIEFKNKIILNRSLKKYNDVTIIDSAIQKIALKLDEKGVKLMSYAKFVFKGAAYKSKQIIIKCPFIIILKNKDKDYPYFMSYVCNNEVLVKSNINAFEGKTYEEILSNNVLMEMLSDPSNFYSIAMNIENINAKDKNGSTALIVAVKKKDVIKEIIRKLLPNDLSEAEKEKCANNNYNDLIEYLLHFKADVNIKDIHNKTALIYAFENKDEHIIAILKQF